MATDISNAPPVANPDAEQNETQPLTNGDTLPETSTASEVNTNQDSFVENAALPTTTVDVNKTAPPDPNPAGPTPVDDVTGGIQPVADFLPKDVPPHSHPTPPPDQPLITSEADVDTAMTGTDDAPPPAESVSEPQPAAASEPSEQVESAPVQESAPPPEPSLVRPREDDDADVDEERAAKRTRVEGEEQPGIIPAETAPAETAPAESAPATNGDVIASRMDEAPASTEVAAPVQAETDSVNAPAPADPAGLPEAAPGDAVPAQPSADAPAQEPSEDAAVKPSIEGGTSEASAPAPAPASAPEPVQAPAAAQAPASAPASGAKYDTKPMTSLQKSVLVEKTKNLKKTKHSVNFLRPVDPAALNIPTYPDIIKNPMDLGTLDQKLKSNQYASVQDFANDFDLILQNCRTFNGDQHPITIQARSMEAYFDKMMEAVPSADEVAAPKAPQKRASPAVKQQPKREPRQVAAPSSAETYALQGDGVPEIRRTSNVQRPARAIKPPANRDIPYAKPKRKEHQLELRFCEHALDEIRSPRYGASNSVFLLPVDPVALNIPHYRQVIKNPMDLTTMAQKLKQGQYGSAKEFRKDFDLMIDNCLHFNPIGNPVRDMGIQLRRHFDDIWRTKDKWERQNKPESARGTSDDDDSDAEEEDDDDAPEDDKEQTIQALQKQLADMQNMIAGMAAGGTKPNKVKKPKNKDKDSRRTSKIGSMSAAPKASKSAARAPKPKAPKKQKLVSYDEKQEISDAVTNMDEEQLGQVTSIITSNVARYKDQDDMELEIDDLPNNVQHMLLKFVRGIFGKPKTAGPPSPPDDGELDDDEDFEDSVRGPRGGGSKRKKHRPMGKREQQQQIQNLNAKLEQFKQAQTSGSESPTGGSSFQAKAESSDDESEESEEE